MNFLSGFATLIKSINTEEVKRGIVGFIICVLISALLLLWFKKFKKEPPVQFDRKYLYLGSSKIDLRYVTKLERPVFQGENTNYWIIYYIDNNVKSTIKIDTAFRRSEFKKFKKIVLSANSKAKIDSTFWDG